MNQFWFSWDFRRLVWQILICFFCFVIAFEMDVSKNIPDIYSRNLGNKRELSGKKGTSPKC